MIDIKKIEEAALDETSGMYGESESLENGFIIGAKWAINEFLKDLWHPAKEIPKEGKPVLVTYTRGGYNIVSWEAYNFSGQVNYWTLDITQWLYIDDLFPKSEK